MNALVFTLRLLEPLLATQPQSGEANSATTLLHIPGSMVRGAVVTTALGGKAMDAGDPQAQRLFLSGAVQFLNAYLAHPTSGERMLPIPLSWLVEKDEADRDDISIRDMANRDWELNNPKPPQKGRFVWHGKEGAQLGSPRLHVAIHTASLDRNRKVAGESQVFRYEALAAGQSFVGVIGAKEAGDLDLIKPWLETVERLGGAQTAGYGRVTVENTVQRDDWPEYTPAVPADAYVVVTLLSDLLLRDGGGSMADAPGKALGITAELLRAYRRLRVTGGFNRKWGLPLPQGWAIEAGSVFVYPAAGLDRLALKRASEQGIGERTAEGYGRIAIDWHTHPSVTQCPLEKPLISRLPLPVMSAESKRLAQRMATRRLEAQLDRSLVAQIGEKMGPNELFSNLPSAAQLSRARLAARQAWETGDLTAIDKHLTGLKSAAREWERTRLRKWIEQQIQLDEAAFLRQFDLAQGLPAVAEESADMDAATWANLRAKTIARLIEGVLKQAVELKKQATEGGRS